MQLVAEDIDSICDYILELCGVYLDESKSYLIESRLADIAARAGCANYTELIETARKASGAGLRKSIIDAITTHETLFFRDNAPFEALQHRVIPDLIDLKEGTASATRIRIWSAACSTGQEPYSIAITLCELIPDIDRWDVTIVASDISDDAVAKASRGSYKQHEIDRGLPSNLLQRYFVREGNSWRVNDRLRAMISFRQLNLQNPLPPMGQFDIVFCRNVAIYFTPTARAEMFQRIQRVMPDHGYLFVGSSETLTDLGASYVPQHHCRTVFYQPNLAEELPDFAGRRAAGLS